MKELDTPEKWLAALARQEEAAIERLCDRYKAKLTTYVLRNKGTKEDALELLTDVVLALCRYADKVKQIDENTITRLFYFICKRKWLTKLASYQKKGYVSQLDIEKVGLSAPVSPEEDERIAQLRHLIRNAPLECQQLLFWFYEEDLSFNEIGLLLFDAAFLTEQHISKTAEPTQHFWQEAIPHYADFVSLAALRFDKNFTQALQQLVQREETLYKLYQLLISAVTHIPYWQAGVEFLAKKAKKKMQRCKERLKKQV